MNKIVIAEYDPAWPEAFEREREAIVTVLGEAMAGVVAIEHAAQHGADRAGYSEAKSPFIEAALALA